VGNGRPDLHYGRRPGDAHHWPDGSVRRHRAPRAHQRRVLHGVNGVDYPINIIGQQQYNEITLKTQQQQIIEQLLYINDFPNGIITLWPTPSAAVPLVLSIDRVMTAIATTATALTYPPGYLIYMKHALGLMLAPDYGVTPSQIVVDIARGSKAASSAPTSRR
jgi:hypothetical protein